MAWRNEHTFHALPGLKIFGAKVATSKATCSNGQVGSLRTGYDDPQLETDSKRAEVLNDYSPTVVNDDIFGDQQGLLHEPHESAVTNPLIENVFKNLPFASGDQFLEEFQYTIVTSNLLNETNRYRHHLNLKKSILDFHNQIHVEQHHDIPTKYGLLKSAKNRRYLLCKNFNYNTIVLACLRLLMKMRRWSNSRARARVTTIILIALYLTFQQEIFFSQYTKYKTLRKLKMFLSRLSGLDSLFQKFHLYYKELKNPSFTRLGDDTKAISTTAKNVLVSNLNAVFYKLRFELEGILPLTNKCTLRRYCDLYAIKQSDIVFYLNEEPKHLTDKAYRVKLIQRFFLCCLLSLEITTVKKSPSKNTFFDTLFDVEYQPVSGPRGYFAKPVKIFNTALTVLDRLENFMHSSTSSLTDYKSFLDSKDNLCRESQGTASAAGHADYDAKVSPIYNLLETFQQQLGSIDSQLTDSDKHIILYKLKNLIDIVDEPNKHSTSTTHRNLNNENLFASSRRGSGFPLDVFKTEGGETCANNGVPNVETPINLSKRVEIITINSDDASLSDQSEEPPKSEFFYKPVVFGIDDTNRGCQNTHTSRQAHQPIPKLSDDELRRRLNEKIHDFATENKNGKSKLRAQKSFELLKRRQRENASNKKSNTEECIPVIYEMRSLLES
ncbi:Inp2p KNAG_0I00840 [Huiozyma naganishii CBS 8797]|uniref:Inheritance of peroxisomes protein 2 n=1 Tax=Huiozyma naganishii (strain ATCC MYA-139 / BCRC 22969 / CBS 8797 / KCTC 17520 / NBRC 10181 / NCYC 3082 / Yp74L-3) TaxID=1071383 RepID=J7RAH8_HUIN7|nr:hypothetical protein KNAG_0I00840 [Kazachstania naganishii CBS 8797]CCK71875.1 hypothetical protein KNAG_0I00840 [Kazachstania naganishii CBS 8797]